MIFPNLRITFRKILKQKLNLAINITGLSIGLAVSAIIFLNVGYEFSYDKFFKNAEDIYRIRYDRYQNDNLVFKKAMSLYCIGPLIKDEIPEVKNYARVLIERVLLFRDEIKFNDQPCFWADSTFLNVIPLKMIRGDASTALNRPYTVVLSRSTAMKFFGNENPVDSTIFLNEHLHFTVTGVFEDLPENSHMLFNVLLSLSTGNVLWPGWGTNNRSWGGDNWLYTYVTLDKGSDPKLVEKKISKVVEEHLPEGLKQKNILPRFYLQRITDIHLNSNLENEIQPNGNKRNVYLILLMGLVILIIAWVNFINISIAEASGKAREIGVRKVFGALQKNLIYQFITEAFLINLTAYLVSILIISLTLPSYSSLIGKPLVEFLYSHLFFYLFFFLAVILGTLLSGIYPAIVLSSFDPMKVLKGSIFAGREKYSFKKTLVIIQMAATTVLILCVLIIFKQINYIRSKELGFDKNNVIVIHAPGSLNRDTTKYTKFQTFKGRLLANGSIEAVTSTYFIPGMELLFDTKFTYYDNKPVDEIVLKNNTIENDFIKVYKINLIAGENFSEIRGANRNNIVINESVLPLLGLKKPNDAIGHFMKTSNNQVLKIIGVYSDFHQESLHSKIKPAFYSYGHPLDFGNYQVRINPYMKPEAISVIENEWRIIYPNDPFNYFFEDMYIESLYKPDLRFGQIIIVFTVLSVFLASLGLLGLIMIISAKNTKSIGIRKVSGATVSEIIFLLTKSFLKWISVAFIIAAPLGYYMMDKWLKNFAYRTEITCWIFALTGVLVLIITIVTIIWQTWRAATRNPVETLKYE